MIRLAHFSDIHVSARKLEWQIQDYLNKRFAGWVNLRWLGRRYRFRYANNVLRLLFAELRSRELDHVVFSGDATALGFEAELKIASELMGLDKDDLPPGLAVPGNHDYATKAAAGSGLFEKYFTKWQDGIRVEGGHYPFAQQVGDVWLIGVNSSTANRWAWDATGRIGPEQTQRFRDLIAKIPNDAPRILVTHYPVCLATGKKEKSFRKLRDLRQFLSVAIECKVSLWLHGHRHRGYVVNDADIAPFPIVCVGSATQSKLWSYNEYTIEDGVCKGLKRAFDPDAAAFRDKLEFELPMGR